MKTVVALLLIIAGVAEAAGPAQYRCQELTHAVDGLRCRTHPRKGVLYFTVSAQPGTPLRDRAEARLQEIVQQAALEFRDRHVPPPAVVIRARGRDGGYRDRRCSRPSECLDWEPRQASMDTVFPPTADPK